MAEGNLKERRKKGEKKYFSIKAQILKSSVVPNIHRNI